MASIISVDNIRSTGGTANIIDIDSSANTTAITIDSNGRLGDLTMNGEGGTGNTSVRQGLAKSWVSADTGSTVATNDSFNHSSVTDNATGDESFNFTNNMSNDDYAVSGCAKSQDVAFNGKMTVFCFASVTSASAIGTSFFRITTLYGNSGSALQFARHADLTTALAHGDLA